MDTKECRHILLKYIGLENKLPKGSCVDCHSTIIIDKKYSFAGFYDGKDTYRLNDKCRERDG